MQIKVLTLCPILDYFNKVEDIDNKISANYFRNNVFGMPLFVSTELDEIKAQIVNYEQMQGAEDSSYFIHLDPRNILVICKHYDTIVNVYKLREFII